MEEIHHSTPSTPLWRQRYAPLPAASVKPVAARSWDYENGYQDVWHAHREAQLLYTTRGALRVLTSDGIWMLAPFQSIWLPPGVPHEVHAIGDVTARTTYVVVEVISELRSWTQSRVLQISPLIDALLLTLANGDTDDNPRRAELALPLFILELTQAPAIHRGTLPLPGDRRLRAVCEQMLLCPENNDTVERWGERVGASTRTLARLFREETGLSFGQWRQQLRLIEAVSRLALGVPVTTVAAELGYQSASAFISMFRKTLGDTPQRYLKRREVN